MKIDNQICWFEIYVQDLPRAKAFYEAVFNTTLTHMPEATANEPTLEMWAFPRNPTGSGACGAIVKMEGVRSGGSGTMVYFSCESCPAAVQRAVDNGGKIFKDTFSIGPAGHMAIVQDPDGNIIGLHAFPS